jgi:chemotaxis protein CheD
MSRHCFLKPGELYFGAGDVRVETLLGPCVSIVLWFPQVAKGGMCHFQLPGRRQVVEHARDLDGRYGSEAWVWLKQQVRVHGLNVQQAEVKLFGGARSLSQADSHLRTDIGAQNIAFVEQLMDGQNVRVAGRDLGGEGCRFVRFELATGEVWVRRGAALSIEPQQAS